MQQPTFLKLTEEEQKSLIDKIETNQLSDTEKGMISDVIQFILLLQDKVKTSELKLSNLKRLFASNSESLKKLLQTF